MLLNFELSTVRKCVLGLFRIYKVLNKQGKFFFKLRIIEIYFETFFSPFIDYSVFFLMHLSTCLSYIYGGKGRFISLFTFQGHWTILDQSIKLYMTLTEIPAPA